MGDENDISYLLKTHKPRIVVDEHGGESAKCYHFLDRASFSQWVESFAGRTRSHPRLPRWIRHKTSLAARTVRPTCLSLSPTALFTTRISDHRAPASTSASGAIHFSLPMTTQCNTTCELDYRFAGGNIPHEDIPKVLPCMFDARDYQDCILRLPEQDVKMWTDRSDQVLNP